MNAYCQLSVCCVFRCLVINCIDFVPLFIGLNRDLLLFSTHCAPSSINTSASPLFPSPSSGWTCSFLFVVQISLNIQGVAIRPFVSYTLPVIQLLVIKKKKRTIKQWLSITRLIVSHASFCALVDLQKKETKAVIYNSLLFLHSLCNLRWYHHRLFHEGTRNVFFIPETILVAIV